MAGLAESIASASAADLALRASCAAGGAEGGAEVGGAEAADGDAAAEAGLQPELVRLAASEDARIGMEAFVSRTPSTRQMA